MAKKEILQAIDFLLAKGNAEPRLRDIASVLQGLLAEREQYLTMAISAELGRLSHNERKPITENKVFVSVLQDIGFPINPVGFEAAQISKALAKEFLEKGFFAKSFKAFQYKDPVDMGSGAIDEPLENIVYKKRQYIGVAFE